MGKVNEHICIGKKLSMTACQSKTSGRTSRRDSESGENLLIAKGHSVRVHVEQREEPPQRCAEVPQNFAPRHYMAVQEKVFQQ